MRRASIALVTMAVLLALPSAAGAISRGTPDTAHPMVAALGDIDPATGLVQQICGATLVSDTVLVTAGHCTSPEAGAPPAELRRVNFTGDASPDADGWQPVAATYTHPGLGDNQSTAEDVGVVVLPEGSAPDVPHATLPDAGRLSALAGGAGLIDVSFDLVGYGSNHFGATSGLKSVVCEPPARTFATAPFGGLTQHWLQLRMNGVATGEGGQCPRDSGSPVFLPGTLEIVAVTHGSPGAWCRENIKDYRLDTAAARDFLAQYVDLP